ncbi:2-amino-4-hydroxy-6-hydroxymethyldihydropteridine diphosphokinase [Psychrobacter sp. JB385]|uniref:2-amino-4-hydroxy-6- hydroxymethyldihydropteridine diphosphokinase n=1 Tax=Psychrobacter sp. JB385 TaxID=1434841 RepID=UPI00097E86CA|nr:2-amino-4-hydroxy-6-hydroxymethyldihydropteridine diphosphokinase [Psychrobacter sp. JB385]SJN43031.1 2-amino-4-hydroxy-6-hydroxymethyldihydropteridinepyrophosphokinase [Psychrobacter sp. JB385]
MDNSANDSHWVTCYVGLGSNLANDLGSPVEHLQQALINVQDHEKIRDVSMSSFYASAPMGPQDQPDFINAVAGFETVMTPFELLTFCQHLEEMAKRARLRRWGERSLDVDILLYGDLQMTDSQLTIPHAGLPERNFVLIPLKELAPDLKISGIPIQDYPQSADWTGLTRLSNS